MCNMNSNLCKHTHKHKHRNRYSALFLVYELNLIMKFADKNPPRKDGVRDPHVETYHYYLSFLERYIEETKTIRQDLRKVYLVRAEYRYIRWLHNSVYVMPPTGTLPDNSHQDKLLK